MMAHILHAGSRSGDVAKRQLLVDKLKARETEIVLLVPKREKEIWSFALIADDAERWILPVVLIRRRIECRVLDNGKDFL